VPRPASSVCVLTHFTPEVGAQIRALADEQHRTMAGLLRHLALKALESESLTGASERSGSLGTNDDSRVVDHARAEG
jgi:hypothetical protein